MFGASSKFARSLLRTGPLLATTTGLTIANLIPSSPPVACEAAVHRDKTVKLMRKETTLRQAVADSMRLRPRRFNTKEELNKIRIQEEEIFKRWERDEDGWRELPARAWPTYQPKPDELKGIRIEISEHRCTTSSSNDLCKELLFNVATCLVFYNVDPEAGFRQYEELAKAGHIDSMVACGVILVEGFGIARDELKGIEWLQKAVARNSAQACYELGTVFYTGIDGIVEEDPKAAFELFQRAAEQDHTAGLFMMADCLVEGDGAEQNVAQAVPLFFRAADRGHRFSRQRIRELLARKEYK